MNTNDRIYVAGHRGLAGSAIVRGLNACGCDNILTRTHNELDLTRKESVAAFFAAEKPDYVFLAAARVGGILANSTYPAEYIQANLEIQTNVIHESWRTGVKRLLFLGSSCIYPRECPQPIREEYLLTGPLEATNRPYAIAKIAGIEMCWAFNRQYGTCFLAAMPTNLYGRGDHYDLQDSHVVPALIRKMHEAKIRGDERVTIWGTGAPRREFLYSDDMADACVMLMRLPDTEFRLLLAPHLTATGAAPLPPLINIGCGADLTILELAETIAKVIGFDGKLTFDADKPDGTPRKQLDVGRLFRLGWRPKTALSAGITLAYRDYLASLKTRTS